MRSKQALKNTLANMILQVIVLVSGIILPRFFLEAYCSSVNGMITSANQFLTYLSLAEAGVGTASLIALYTPLANNDARQVSSVLSASKQFYYRSGAAFGALLLGLIGIYPLLISQQLSAGMVRSMLVVLGLSTFIEYCFLGKYKVLLQADQKGYVLSLAEAVGTVFTIGITIILIRIHVNVVLVKSVTTMIFFVRFFVIRFYVKKKYPLLDFKEKPDYSALHQRGAALLHQVVGVIVNNTDVVLLTVLLGARSLLEVSVYGIYNLVAYAINTLLSSFSNGLTAGFGEVVSKKEKQVLKSSFGSYEYVFFIVLFTAGVCMLVLMLPFIAVYTKKMSDINYIRPLIAVLFTVIVFAQNLRVPSLTIVNAAGHFKQTRGQAVLEAVINLVVSLALIKNWGMAGVLIGTICSYGYRSFATILYNERYLVPGTGVNTFKRIIRNVILAVISGLIGIRLVPQTMDSFITWFVYAVIVGVVNFVLFCLLNFVFEPGEFRNFMKRLQKVFMRSK